MKDNTNSKQTQAASVDSDILDHLQAASYLHITERTLRLWRSRRALPHLKITSRIVRYRRADLDSWLETHRTVIGGAC